MQIWLRGFSDPSNAQGPYSDQRNEGKKSKRKTKPKTKPKKKQEKKKMKSMKNPAQTSHFTQLIMNFLALLEKMLALKPLCSTKAARRPGL